MAPKIKFHKGVWFGGKRNIGGCKELTQKSWIQKFTECFGGGLLTPSEYNGRFWVLCWEYWRCSWFNGKTSKFSVGWENRRVITRAGWEKLVRYSFQKSPGELGGGDLERNYRFHIRFLDREGKILWGGRVDFPKLVKTKYPQE